MRCEEVHELAPEIALGIADGELRAQALRHLATCPECRRVVEEFSAVGDELLMLAPEREPPVGFESRVVDAVTSQEPPPRRSLLRRLAPLLAAAVTAAAITAGALVAVYRDDHVTAERYRDTLERAGGRYFQAEPLVDETGRESGVAFGYEGTPSWVLVTVAPAQGNAVASGEIVTRDGRRVPLTGLELDQQGSWGGAIPVRLDDVASIRLLGNGPGELLEASFPRPDGEVAAPPPEAD